MLKNAPKQRARRKKPRSFRLILCLLFCCLPVLAQSPQPRSIETDLPQAPGIGILPGQNAPDRQEQQSSGTVFGTVVDQNGDAIVSARVRLTRNGLSGEQEAVSDAYGQYIFTGVAAGPFQLTVSAEGFATQPTPGILHAGETLEVPNISLPVAVTVTDVHVSGAKSDFEMAEAQIHVEEKQRVLGVIPNFYVTYDHNAVSLASKQKFELAWKSSVDPVTFAFTAVVAGAEQAENEFSGYGQGAQGYAKRYGASYADSFIGTMIGGAILPSLLKQDPRYFYKGTGGTRARILYALANAVICKGDNGRWQTNYSGILGSLAAGGISNLYYPASSRNGAELTFENTLIGIASAGASNLFQEFIVRKFTPHLPPLQTVVP